MTQELVAAAYREQHAAIGHIGGKLAFSRDHGVFHDHLLSIGATADEHDIGLREIHGVAHAHLTHLDGQTAPLQTTRKGNHVATIAVEVQKLGEQMHDGKRLHIVAHRGHVGPFQRIDHGLLLPLRGGFKAFELATNGRQRGVVRNDVHLAIVGARRS